MIRILVLLIYMLSLCGCSGSMAPIADAGADQTVTLGATVSLSAAASDKVNGDALKYSWTITSAPEGSQAQLSDPATINPTFTPDKIGEYKFSLIVNNHYWDSEPVEIKITCTPAPYAIDPSGLVQATDLAAFENFRNETNVNFSIKLTTTSTMNTRINIGIPIYGKDDLGGVVFNRKIELALSPNETKTMTISYGEPLTITEYDSIITWTAGEITIY